MARNVFISFRYSDGITYKRRLTELFNSYYYTVDFSEDQDRSRMTEETIRQYLYSKLRKSSVTIILLTPQAVNHKKKWNGDEYEERPLLSRLALHAYKIELNHPRTGERISFTAPYPKDMEATRKQLSKIFGVDPLE